MGTQCGGGISAPKLGAQLTVGVGSAYIAQLFEIAGIGALAAAAPLLVIPEILLSNFCANDPPAYTTLTPAEANAILQVQFTPDFFSGVPKLIQVIERLVWFDQCYCQTGTLVPNTPAPQPPAGTFIPVPVSPPQNQACYSNNPVQFIDSSVPDTCDNFGVPSQFMSQATTVTIDELVAYNTAGTLQLTWHYRFTINNNILDFVDTPTETFTGGTFSNHLVFSVPVGTTSFGVCFHQNGGTGTLNLESVFHLYCGGGPGPQAPCCPPDPRTQATLDAIINLLNKILAQEITPRLPLYTPSTVHAGLTGSGAITIGTKSVAFRVDVTSDLSTWPHNIQDPTYYFSMGFITSLAVDTPIKGWRLVYQSQTYPLAAECDQVAYTLPAGITVNITELLEQVQP